MRLPALTLMVLLLLTGAAAAPAQPLIEGLSDDDLAVLTASIVNADTVLFVMTLRIDGDPGLTDGLALEGPGAVGRDDGGHALIIVESEGLFDPGGRHEEPVFGWMRLVEDNLYLRVADDDHWRVMPVREIEAWFAATGLPDALGAMSGLQAHDYPGWLEALGLDAFASGTRLEDTGGRTRFRIDVDPGAWLNSPAFNNLTALAAALADTQLTIRSTIDGESGWMERLELELDIRLNASLLPGSGSDDETVEGSLLLILDNLRYDYPLRVDAPAQEDTRPA